MMVRLESRLLLSTYVVSTTADSGAGSLRQAIIDANGNPGADTVNFSIGTGVQTISPGSALPGVTGPVTLDGTTQGGYTGSPLIEINGANAGYTEGLIFSAGNNTIRGLVINRFAKAGINILWGDNNVIENCYIGTDPTGLIKQSNGGHGIYVGSGNNRIGGTLAAQRNIISGQDTLNASGVFTYGGSFNSIIGNYIGVGADGRTAIPNYTGMAIFGGSYNVIGSTQTGAGNVISGNKQDGLLLFSDTHHNTVQQNLIGTDSTGTIAVANGDVNTNLGWGIELQGHHNLIGGTDPAARNILSGNVGSGLTFYLGTSQYNLVHGNYIGTDITGTKALPNLNQGVSFSGDTDVDPTAIGPQFNIVGGTTAAERNIISGNGNTGNGAGVGFFNRTGSNQVLGNFIGTDVTGTKAIPNDNGVALFNLNITNIIGGTAAGSANVISGNAFNGINIGAQNTIVQGNLIGTDHTGAAPLPNKGAGVLTIFSSHNTIGGPTLASRNVISFNGDSGVKFAGGGQNTLQNNYIGVDITGVTPAGNGSAGVWIDPVNGGSNNNTVTQNIIANNGGPSAVVVGGGVGNRIYANRIYNNVGLVIDLGNNGSTANDSLDGDSGANNLQNYPVLASAYSDTLSKTWVSGSINSIANATFTLDFYATTADNSSQIYLGTGQVTTDGAGNGLFNLSFNVASPVGSLVSATATAGDGSTSEFSLSTWVPLPGDANRDRVVDLSDLALLAAHYGQAGGATWQDGDFNNDSIVDVSDLALLGSRYGTSLPTPSAPLPATMMAVASESLAPVSATSNKPSAKGKVFAVSPPIKPVVKPKPRRR